MDRKEAYNFLKQFVLEQMRVPDWPHYPMNDLREVIPPPVTTGTRQAVITSFKSIILDHSRYWRL